MFKKSLPIKFLCINIYIYFSYIKIWNLNKRITKILYLKNFYIFIFNRLLFLYPCINSKFNYILCRTYSKLIFNMFYGVLNTYSRFLIFEGNEYTLKINKNIILINVGFSFPIKLSIPKDIFVEYDYKIKRLKIISVDNIKLGIFCYKILSIKKYNFYKLKGIRFIERIIKQKKIIKR